jgi:hypothetical protein
MEGRGEFEFAKDNVLQGCGPGVEGSPDLPACGITVGVQNATAAVRGFPRKRQLCAVAVKLCAPVYEFLNALRPFFHQHVGSVSIYDPVACLDCVLQMQADFIFVAQSYGDPALSILRVRLSQFLLGQDQHFAGLSQRDCSAQSGNTGPDNNEIHVLRKFLHVKKMVAKHVALQKSAEMAELRDWHIVYDGNA